MELNLTRLLRLSRGPDFHSSHASYYVHLPDLAPFGYLYTIFAPPDPEALKRCSHGLQLPGVLQGFFAYQNGADLFFNALSLFGVLEPGRLFSRMSDRAEYPFDLQELNRQSGLTPEGEWLLIGSYSFDGTRVMLHRSTGGIQAVERKRHQKRSEWPCFGTYLKEEIERLLPMYSEAGKLLVEKKYTVPGSEAVA